MRMRGEDTVRLSPYLSMAVQILSEHDLEVEEGLLAVIVEAALEARRHYFAAALHHPDEEELERFLTDFVLRCVIPNWTSCD
jgi:hypothetical protein